MVRIVVLGLVGAAMLARGLPRRALTATFGAGSLHLGPWSVGPRTVIRWTGILPLVAAIAYGWGRVG